jgi:exodeoxyribonuclease V beta subunit
MSLAPAMVGSEPERAALDDEPAIDEPPVLQPATIGGSAAEVVSPMAGLPGGTSFGSLVHGVLETVDPAAADLEAEVRSCLGEQLGRWGAGPAGSLNVSELVTALVAVYESPLGSGAGGRRLRDFALADRLTEMSFELPLAGGDGPGGELALGDLAPVLRRHLSRRQPADPLAAYCDRLGEPLLKDQSMRGFLNGSLDAVLRVRDPGGGGSSAALRYVVVDYKTNWLGAAPAGSGTLTAADYTPDRLAAAMLASDYPLQALLYSVALHRYLRWRQPGYSPDQHLGGVLYLYVRGMCGPQTPLVDGAPCGVFSWQPPPELIVELSDLLDRGLKSLTGVA